MITLKKRIYAGTDRFIDEYVGLSTDTKPTGNLNGSSFYEMDTGTTYYFDEDNASEKWITPSAEE